MDGIRLLRRLAALYSVQTSFKNVEGQTQWASPEALCGALQGLGASLKDSDDVPEALRARRYELASEVLSPVIVAWDDHPLRLRLRLPLRHRDKQFEYTLVEESGPTHAGLLAPGDSAEDRRFFVDGREYVERSALLSVSLPHGYHRLIVPHDGVRHEVLVIAAPSQVYSPVADAAGRLWGVFAPLYALHSEHDWGCGDFTDAETLVSWTAGLGGRLVGTLPCLAAFLDTPCDPSPYTPASRLFWNELFVDITRIPELALCPAAQGLIGSPAFAREIADLRAGTLIDYRRQMALKRRVLSVLAETFFAHTGDRRADTFRRLVNERPLLEAYANFRAAMTLHGPRWRNWPSPSRAGELTADDAPEAERRYHLYVQFIAEEQMSALADRARATGVRLYFDLPLGVHADGFDTWRWQRAFVHDVSVGAPPDAYFTTGQSWGFPPWHPQTMRRDGYAYLIACLRHQMRHAKILRLDHVMGLHRMYWIPRGLGAHDGVYVHYPSRELHAILALESHRHQATLVGENLGIVPGYVTAAMQRHGMTKMSVIHYDLLADPDWGQRRLAHEHDTLAGLGTHDMHPFAAFWSDRDIADRVRLGHTSPADAERERAWRIGRRIALIAYLRERGLLTGESPADVLRAILSLLGAANTRHVLVNLEDLWLETEPQNIPGTVDEHPNWQRKMRRPLEAFTRDPEVVEMLRAIDDLRTSPAPCPRAAR